MRSSNACSSAATGEASICRPTFEPRTNQPVCFDSRRESYRHCEGNTDEPLSDFGVGLCHMTGARLWKVPLLRKCTPFKIKHWCARVPIPVALVYMTP